MLTSAISRHNSLDYKIYVLTNLHGIPPWRSAQIFLLLAPFHHFLRTNFVRCPTTEPPLPRTARGRGPGPGLGLPTVSVRISWTTFPGESDKIEMSDTFPGHLTSPSSHSGAAAAICTLTFPPRPPECRGHWDS